MSIGFSTPNVTGNISDVEVNQSFYPHYPMFCEDRPVGPLIWLVVSVSAESVGIPASLWLLRVFVQRHRSGLTNDVFMLNLTIMDLIYNILNIPYLLNYFIWQSRQLAFVLLFFLWFGLTGRPFFMTCVCVDCYLAVVHPIPYMKTMKREYKMGICAFVWIFTTVYSIATTVILGNEIEHLLTIIIPYVLYLPTIGLCDFFVLRALRKPDPSGRNTIHPQKQRAQQTIINSLMMSIVAYLPPVISGSLLYCFPYSYLVILCNVFLPSTIGPNLGSNVMPILYLSNLGQLRDMMAYIRNGCK